LLCALALEVCAQAADLQSWNSLEFGLFTNRRVRWSATTSLRFRDRVHRAYDFYLGSMARIPLTSRWAVTAGYLYRQVNPNRTSFHPEHRLIVAPSLLLHPGKTRVEAAIQYERLKPAGPAYNRYRPRLVLERVRPGLSPFLSTEGMLAMNQFQRSRNMAGVRWHFEQGSMIEIGYQFETMRSGPSWIPRHAIRTSFVIGDLHHLRHAD
jgi:hypothetical protein